ncbi:hypothetical protein BJX65DRAFT_34172 [Aspergillus insuetus]
MNTTHQEYDLVFKDRGRHAYGQQPALPSLLSGSHLPQYIPSSRGKSHHRTYRTCQSSQRGKHDVDWVASSLSMDEVQGKSDRASFLPEITKVVVVVVVVEATTIEPSQYDAFMGCSFPDCQMNIHIVSGKSDPCRVSSAVDDTRDRSFLRCIQNGC